MSRSPNSDLTDVFAFSERLEALYASRTFGELMQSSIELLRPVFDADYWCVGFCEPTRQRVVAFGWPIDFPVIDHAHRLRDLAEQSPLFQHWSRNHDHDRVLRRTDCCDEAQFQTTALYNELIRPLSLRQQIGTWLRPGGGRHMEIGMYRTGQTEFTEQDVARLAMLRNHIMRAYKNLIERPVTSDDLDLPNGAFELQRTDLSVHLDDDSDKPARDEATTIAPIAPNAAIASLTQRERDVIRLLAAGKTNQEIAASLGTKWRTVSKQLESIFRKLDVQTRTAAAMRAVELSLHR